jgi:signal transduction histidine kinase
MTNLVEVLLSISRIQSGKYKINLAKTDLKSLLESINKQFTQTQLKPGLQIEMELPKELEEVMIDQDKIRQVISNLVDNAVKYSDKGKIKINVQQYQKETLISVSDDGKGVSKEDRDKLFEPFFRGTNILEIDNRGTGLGLYIARLIINHHKGKIWLEPKEKGAEFKFSLPR